MGEESFLIGHRFRKTDGTEMVFEVEDVVLSFGLPHVRLALVADPTDKRVIAVSMLADRKAYVHVSAEGQTLPSSEIRGRLQLAYS